MNIGKKGAIKMSKANEMFEKLGYKLEESKSNIFIIDDIENIAITIHKLSKLIRFYKMTISKDELQAINQKVKELGWNE